ncbi:MAG TPA: suppressor of fused domain protein [Tepidisphaeraceae bacterium]|nr:suppressor of fused domain protein [Tepidisphaeraceae bacterium]
MAPEPSDANRLMTTHWIAHLGVPREIHPRALNGFDGAFAILEFAPRGSRASWRYATNGMSSRVQACPQPGVRVRTELYGATIQRAPWMCDLLTALAAYPWDQQTWLAEGDTIELRESPTSRNCPFAGIMLAWPGAIDPPEIGLAGDSEPILIHQLAGLLSAELEQAKHGSDCPSRAHHFFLDTAE